MFRSIFILRNLKCENSVLMKNIVILFSYFSLWTLGFA